MKKVVFVLGLMLLVAAVPLACAPAAPPAPSPAPAPQAPPAAPALSPVEAAWAKVVEAAKKEGEVTIYSFNFVGDVGLALARAFDEKYGIKLNIITGRGAEFIERLKTEKRMGRMVADVSEGAATHMLNMKASGVTITLSDIPVFQEKGVWLLDPRAIDAEAHVLGVSQSIYSPWINTRLLKAEQVPRSYLDLLKPEWKGRVVAHDPVLSSAAYNYFVPLVNAGALDWEYVQALGRQEMRLERGGVQAAEVLARGEFPIILMNTDSNSVRFVKEGAPIKAISWQEGNVSHLTGMVAIKDAPHPNSGLVLVNWFLNEEGQKIRGEAQGIAMVRKGVPDFRPADARAPDTKWVVSTAKDYDDQARLMREGLIAKLWKVKP